MGLECTGAIVFRRGGSDLGPCPESPAGTEALSGGRTPVL